MRRVMPGASRANRYRPERSGRTPRGRWLAARPRSGCFSRHLRARPRRTRGVDPGDRLRLRPPASRNAWSWLPFAVGIPLLPVYGWLGAVGTLPGSFALLIPAAVLAGAALAVANARADYERDVAAGAPSVATALGLRRSWTVHAALLGTVLVVAVVTLAAADVSERRPRRSVRRGRARDVRDGREPSGRSGVRERAWELEAIGVGVLAAAWVAGVAAAG